MGRFAQEPRGAFPAEGRLHRSRSGGAGVTAPSVALLRAVGDLQRDMGADRLHLDDIAAEMGRDPLDLAAMIWRGLAAGYLESVSGKICLSAQGWAWYEWDRRQRL